MTESPEPRPAVPPPPEGKRARTRRALIEAAAAVIREKGYANLSMEEVAARAGVSRGSIYGNFRDRNDLIVSVAMDRAPRIVPAPTPGLDLRGQMRAVGQAVAAAARKHRGDTIYWLAYMAQAQLDEELGQRATEQGRLIRKMLAEAWSSALPADALPMPVETFVKVLNILAAGLVMAHAGSPEDFDDEVIITAFEALAGSPRAGERAASGG